jgi:signal transduction histidine kinase
VNLSLTQRLSLVFSVLLLACCGASSWLQIRSSDLHEKEVIQSLSRDLASNIARNPALSGDSGGAARKDALRQIFGQLMVVNPSVEVYLLDQDGRIEGDDAPAGHLKRMQVDVAPVRKFVAGDPLPILGDDPRSVDGRKVFSAALLPHADSRPPGYIYVVLQGEAHDELAARFRASSVLRTTLWSMGVVALLGLVAGVVAFGLITRPLRRLTDAMRKFDANGEPDAQPPVPASGGAAARAAPSRSRDEIATLESTFAQMAERIGQQWRALTKQDQERRELVANISHDLRTPLTSLHGYLETLSMKADSLSDTERKRYLAIALAQSVKVGKLAQSLFELARLEHGNVPLALEDFSLVDLVQDVFQKFELSAEARRIRLRAGIAPRLPNVTADLGMIERVLTNLLDNARHHGRPASGATQITVACERFPGNGRIHVQVTDNGPGISSEAAARLFEPFFTTIRSGTGLGLYLSRELCEFNGANLAHVAHPGPGSRFRITLPLADCKKD